jgi:hypothetical protein
MKYAGAHMKMTAPPAATSGLQSQAPWVMGSVALPFQRERHRISYDRESAKSGVTRRAVAQRDKATKPDLDPVLVEAGPEGGGQAVEALRRRQALSVDARRGVFSAAHSLYGSTKGADMHILTLSLLVCVPRSSLSSLALSLCALSALQLPRPLSLFPSTSTLLCHLGELALADTRVRRSTCYSDSSYGVLYAMLRAHSLKGGAPPAVRPRRRVSRRSKGRRRRPSGPPRSRTSWTDDGGGVFSTAAQLACSY